MTYLVSLALLNRNLRTCSNGKIKGARRRGDIKRNSVCLRRQCYAIGADFVRRVAVGRNSVGTDNHSVHTLRAHGPRCHIIGNQRHRNAVLKQLKRRQARTLQQRARFVGINHLQLALRVSTADNAQRCAPTAGCQCACVAVRQHYGSVRQHSSAVFAHTLIHGNIVRINLLGLLLQRFENRRR